MKIVNSVSILLIIIGAINWGLVGVFDFNLVQFLFGSVPYLVKVVYILVGVAGVYTLALNYESYTTFK